jgi:hypothetical protein
MIDKCRNFKDILYIFHDHQWRKIPLGTTVWKLQGYVGALPELKSLVQERDPQLFYEGLLNLGKHLETRDRLMEATAIYDAIIAQPLERYGDTEIRGYGENPRLTVSPSHSSRGNGWRRGNSALRTPHSKFGDDVCPGRY